MNKKKILNFIYLNLGVFMAAISFIFFLGPNSITGSGLSGLAVVVGGFLPEWLSKATFILLCNGFLLILAFFLMGKEYFIKTAYGALIYPFYQMLINFMIKNVDPSLYEVDMLLAVIFGALLMGVGIGLTMRSGGSTGGGDIIQSIMFKYFNIPYSKTMYVIDGLLVVGCIVIFKDLSLLLFSVLYILLTGIIVDNVVFGGFNKRAVYIISDKDEEIRQVIIKKLVRGTTNLMAYGGYKREEKHVILCVLSTSEYFDLRTMVEEIDPHAFMFVTKSTEVRGFGFSLESEARINARIEKRKRGIVNEKE